MLDIQIQSEPALLRHNCGYERSLRDQHTFSITWELVPGRGAVEKSQENLISVAERAAAGGKVHALTITDNPGGSPALSAEMLGAELARLGIDPLIHLTCKDKNRNELESLLYGLERANIRNLLVMTGDYPKAGYLGGPKPVFDLDPINLLALIGELNQGREVSTPRGTSKLVPAHFFPGVVASPFKALESEQMGQYYKLKKKLEAGAQFVVSQIGFDARKFHELLQVVRLLGFAEVPVVGNIYVLPLGAARLMNRNGLPGCVVPDKLLAKIEYEASSPDKGRAMRFERAAKMLAILKGMGYAGSHLSGFGMTYDDLEYILCRSEEFAPNWIDFVHEFDYPQHNGWYYFEQDKQTGLNTDTPCDRGDRPKASIGYRTFGVMHRALFDPRGSFFSPMRELAKRIDGSRLENAFTRFENAVKGATNDCLHCGDCSMFDLAYLCSQSQCAKNQRNGPCGGSSEGWCEKYPGERQCMYVRAYERLKSNRAEASLGEGRVPPINYELSQTSSWINFYLGRDHSAAKLGIEKIDRKRNKEAK